MVSVRFLVGAAAAAMISTTAYAADMPHPPPPRTVYQPVARCSTAGAWYLRGDIGVGITSQARFDLSSRIRSISPATVAHPTCAIGDTTFFSVGVGYELNNWLRFDVTAEYRTKAPCQRLRLTYNPVAARAATNTGPSCNPQSSSPMPISISAPGTA